MGTVPFTYIKKCDVVTKMNGYAHKLKLCLGVLTALICASLAGFFMYEVVEAATNDDLGVATQCSFVVSPEFLPGTEPGLFINKNYPMESSSIKYSIYENGKDKILTNREKQELLKNGSYLIQEDSVNLTKDIYQTAMAEAYQKAYGNDVGFTVTDFDKKIFDGFPGFKISSEYLHQDNMKVYQTAYIVISKYRTFTITYQRAEDDECQEAFNASAASIRVR